MAEDSIEEKRLSKFKKKSPGKSSSEAVKKEEIDNGFDEKPQIKELKEKKVKKEEAGCNVKLSKVKKEEPTYSNDEQTDKKVKKTEVKANGKLLKVKKEEPNLNDEVDKKKRIKVTTVEVKKIAGQSGTLNEKKQRKVYDLPGQKHDQPEERDPLRIFYESLYQQIPVSEMAAIWMMERGLLPREEAKKVYKRKLKGSSPVIASSMKKTTTVSVKEVEKVTKKTVASTNKRKASSKDSDTEADDDDFVPLKKKQNASG